jgi:dTDP-glucose 4,6-dehydratase
LAETVAWYLSHQDWCQTVRKQAGYDGGRLGINQAKTN